ncbi:hypothetical protein P378_07450 [Desulforamulus profundi]|uniref:DUF2007 domain-containing protein n=1 Tax=Desulforamulus profundi TaxID=1383067 RepID=A0A2C6MH63_9FIRM|nr:DUF2007 domain-containing protein [Desulforamulus profundi]MCL5781377.1 DUF2007 domain-containing protein [Bacillota bacterium]PHJ38813.1 hypothetical protein P378_07450 [Desulforamulus profundi]
MAPKWRLLMSAANMVEAEILKSALESADIPVNLKWESFNAVFFGTSATGPGSQVQVFVPEELWEEARAYLSYSD